MSVTFLRSLFRFLKIALKHAKPNLVSNKVPSPRGTFSFAYRRTLYILRVVRVNNNAEGGGFERFRVGGVKLG